MTTCANTSFLREHERSQSLRAMEDAARAGVEQDIYNGLPDVMGTDLILEAVNELGVSDPAFDTHALTAYVAASKSGSQASLAALGMAVMMWVDHYRHTLAKREAEAME